MNAHPVGTRVRSHFRAPWTGVVVASGADHTFKVIGKCGKWDLYETPGLQLRVQPDLSLGNRLEVRE